jgi:ferric-dicitrate binding protein FerR (iron transport regulator)
MKDEKIISYLKNELAEKDMAEVKKWIGASEENEKYFNRLRFIWENSLSGYQDIEISSGEAWERIHSSISGRDTGRPANLRTALITFRRMAAVIIILIGVGCLFTYLSRQERETDREWISAGTTSGIKDISLADGSHIWLNKNSEIIYPGKFKGNAREIVLKGEAFFEIERNRRKPFIVHTSTSEIRVLGTSFNVKSGRTTPEVIVTVVSGSVSLCDTSFKENIVMLGPGEQGINFSGTSGLLKQENNDMNFLAWKSGILFFEKTTLEDVCFTLSGYFDKSFITDHDEALKDKTLTVTFDNKDLGEVLKILEITLDITCKTGRDTITLSAN